MTNQTGRPNHDDLNVKFSANVKKHKNRNMLQGKVIQMYYLRFVDKNMAVLSGQAMERVFSDYNLKDYFYQLTHLWKTQTLRVSGSDLKNYTSKRDVLYLLHYTLNSSKTIQPKKLYFLVIFLFHASQILNQHGLSFFLRNLNRFEKLVKYGPENNPTDGDYPILEMLTTWTLEMATLENLNVMIPANDSS